MERWFFYFEKMTFLEIFDMYLMIFDINNQYLVRFSQYLININQYSEPDLRATKGWVKSNRGGDSGHDQPGDRAALVEKRCRRRI